MPDTTPQTNGGRERAADAGRKTSEDAARAARLVTDQAAEGGRQAVAGAETSRAGVEAAQKTLASGLNAAVEAAQRSTDQFKSILGVSGEQGDALTRQSSQNLEAIAATSAVLARGFQDISREWLSLPQTLLQKNLERMNALAGCRSVQDLLAMESELARDNLQQVVESGLRIAEVSARVSSEAAQAIANRQAA